MLRALMAAPKGVMKVNHKNYQVIASPPRAWRSKMLIITTSGISEKAANLLNTAKEKQVDAACILLSDKRALPAALKRFLPKVIIPVDESAAAVISKHYSLNGEPISFTRDYRAVVLSLDESTMKLAFKLARMPKFAFSRRLKLLGGMK